MEDTQYNRLRNNIKNLRLKVGLSQDQFVRKANVPYTILLTKIKTEVIKKPSVFVVAKIANVLNVSVDELIG